MFALRTVRMFKLLVWDALTVIESKHTNQNVHSYRIISNIAYYVDCLKSNHCVHFKWQIVNLLTNEREITRAKCLVPVSQIEVKKAPLTKFMFRFSNLQFLIMNFLIWVNWRFFIYTFVDCLVIFANHNFDKICPPPKKKERNCCYDDEELLSMFSISFNFRM